MNNIGRSLTSLKVADDESNKVNSMIENTSILAENVSAKVRRLDEARVNWKEKIKNTKAQIEEFSNPIFFLKF